MCVHLSGCGSVWLERCVRDAEAGGSNPLTPTNFLPKFGKKNMKPEKASLHGTQCRFIRRSRASCTAGALHKSAFSDETAPVFISLRRGKPFHSAMKHFRFRSNMKHFAYASYDDEKMKNESFRLQYISCAADDVKGNHCSELVFERTRYGL